MDILDKILTAIGGLFTVLVGLFGQVGAVLLILGGLILLFIWRWLAQRAAERGWREALAEKDKTIERMASIERSYRIETLVRSGMAITQAERIVLAGRFGGTPASGVSTSRKS